MSDVGLADLDPLRDLPLLERWLRSPHVVQWWGNAAQHLTAVRQRSGDTHAMITSGGRPVGYVCWQRPSREELEAVELTDLPEDLVDIDILIGEPEHVGCGVGPKALTLLLAKLQSAGLGFAGVGTSSANRAAIRACEKAGFRFFRAFEEPEYGACTYMVAELRGAAAPPTAAGGAARSR